MKNFFKNDYDSFYDSLILSDVLLPVIDTHWVPQGICVIEDSIIISCYDELNEADSVLFVYNSRAWKKINLDCKIHCGGICYHKKSNSFFVTGKGVGVNSFVNRYELDKLLEAKDLSTIYVDKVFCVDDDNTLYSSSANHSSVAFIACDKDYIFLGNFIDYKEKRRSVIKRYSILDDGNLSDTYDLFTNPYTNTQGLCIYTVNDIKYYIFSRSFGRKRNSLINICKFVDGRFVQVSSCVLPCMLEQINLYNNDLCLIFESCAKKYSKSCLKVMDKVYIVDFFELMISNDGFKEFNKGTSIFTNNKNIPIDLNYRI